MVKIINAALQVANVNGVDTLIIRGVIAPENLGDIAADSYQREIGSLTKISELARAYRTSTVPDIELGMRGERHNSFKKDTEYELLDPVYVIDGLQRISAAKHFMQTEDGRPMVGCAVHLNTTFEWERERFRILNQDRSKLSPSVLLRNKEGSSVSVDVLRKLSIDKHFILHDRITWSQARKRGELLTAVSLLKTVGVLHSRFGPGRSQRVDELVPSQDNLILSEKIGKISYRQNIIDFFNVVDECFILRDIVYNVSAPQVRQNFLQSVADVFTRYDDFWTGTRLSVSRELRNKLAKFPLRDPSIMALCGGSSTARGMLVHMMVDHLNSGKRTGHLSLNKTFAENAELETAERENDE